MNHLIKCNSKFRDLTEFFNQVSARFNLIHDNMAIQTSRFLHSVGYRGLRCMEGGESNSGAVFHWENSMSYVIFDSNDIEICGEEHFTLKNGKLINLK